MILELVDDGMLRERCNIDSMARFHILVNKISKSFFTFAQSLLKRFRVEQFD